jgi:GTP-binding protein HflX
MAEDLLFATLDPTMRQISLPGLDKAILSDTVGFVSDLPTQLIAAFRATLEEVIAADLIVHVRDISHPDSEAQRADVLDVISELGLGGEGASPMIEAWNKIDMLDEDERQFAQETAARRDDVVLISALDGAGVDDLKRLISAKLTTQSRVRDIVLASEDGAGIAWLYANGEVLESRLEEKSLHVSVRLADADYARFQARKS